MRKSLQIKWTVVTGLNRKQKVVGGMDERAGGGGGRGVWGRRWTSCHSVPPSTVQVPSGERSSPARSHGWAVKAAQDRAPLFDPKIDLNPEILLLGERTPGFKLPGIDKPRGSPLREMKRNETLVLSLRWGSQKVLQEAEKFPPKPKGLITSSRNFSG